MAVSPKNLDLYMLSDEYIRIFEPIPIENVIKVSDIFLKNKVGGTLTTDTEKKIGEIIERLREVGVEVNCV